METMNIKQLSSSKNNIAIIGAGASGLFVSIVLARAGYSVSVFEKNSKLGRKVLATGNGKCNVSNENITTENYHSANISFIEHTIHTFGFDEFKSFFENLGIELMSKENGRVYPLTQQSSTIVDVLVHEAKYLGVNFFTKTNIEKINTKKNKLLVKYDLIETSFSKVIIATGSAAMKKLGSSDIGYKIASSFGHKIIKPFASLVQLESDNQEIKKLHGTKIEANVKLEVNKEYIMDVTKDLLFTSYGLSGNSIIDISRIAAQSLNNNDRVNVIIDILPNISKENLITKLTKRLEHSKNKDKYFWLEGFVNSKLINYIIDSSIKKDIKLASHLNTKDIMSLAYFMKNIKINITSTKGFETAEVSAGGIDTTAIDNKTMQSKLQNDLYFIGEVLDVDGQCGGYNLHWAWASAYVCANSIINNK